MTTALPLIDISRFRDSSADREEFLAELRYAAHEVAWFYADAATHVKIIHYPPRPSADADQGVGVHKDYGYLALLQQDEVGGLQVEKPGGGGWIDAPGVPGSFVFNIGEMLEIATQGY